MSTRRLHVLKLLNKAVIKVFILVCKPFAVFRGCGCQLSLLDFELHIEYGQVVRAFFIVHKIHLPSTAYILPRRREEGQGLATKPGA